MNKKRILAWILSVAMVVTMTPTLAFASVQTPPDESAFDVSTYELVTNSNQLSANDTVIITVENGSSNDYYAVNNTTVNVSDTSIPSNTNVTNNLVGSTKDMLIFKENESNSMEWTVGTVSAAGDYKFTFKNEENKYFSLVKIPTKTSTANTYWYPTIAEVSDLTTVTELSTNSSITANWKYSDNKLDTPNPKYKKGYTVGRIILCDNNICAQAADRDDRFQTVKIYKKIDSNVVTISNLTEATYDGTPRYPSTSKVPSGCDLRYSSNTSIPESDVASSSDMDWTSTPSDFLIDANVTDSNIGDGEEVYVGLFCGSALLDAKKVTVKISRKEIHASIYTDYRTSEVGYNNFIHVRFQDKPENGDDVVYKVVAKNTLEGSHVEYLIDNNTNAVGKNAKKWYYGTYELNFVTDSDIEAANKNYIVNWMNLPEYLHIYNCVYNGEEQSISGLKIESGTDDDGKEYSDYTSDTGLEGYRFIDNTNQVISDTNFKYTISQYSKLYQSGSIYESNLYYSDKPDAYFSFRSDINSLAAELASSTNMQGLGIASINYVDMYVYTYMHSQNVHYDFPTYGVTLNKPIEFELNYAAAEPGKEYIVYHWDYNNRDFDTTPITGKCTRPGYVKVKSNKFSPFVILDTKRFWDVEFESENSGVYFTYENAYDGIGHAEDNKDYTFEVVVTKEYGVPVVKDGSSVIKEVGTTTDELGNVVYTYVISKVTKQHKITASAEKLNTVNYILDSGECASLTTFEKYNNGATVSVSSEVPTKDGYTFAGWENSVDGKIYAAGTSFVINQNVYLTAQWTQVTYNVTYKYGGEWSNFKGTLPTDGISYLLGETVTVSGNTGKLSLDGYIFKGWKVKGTNTVYKPGEKFEISDNVEFVPKWEKGYTVTYSNGGVGVVPIDKTIYEAGTLIYVEENIGGLEKDGYTFNGWKIQGSDVVYKAGAPIVLNDDITLIADWTKGYTVHFDLGKGAGKGGNPATLTDQLVVPGDKLNSVGKIKGFTENVGGTDVDYYFCGWQSQNGTAWDFENDKVEKGSFTADSKEMTLTAVWSSNLHYDIVFDDNLDAPNADYVTINDERGNNKNGKYTVYNVAQGNTITKEKLPKFERVDYKFDGWYLDKECSVDKKFDYTKAVDFNNLQYYANNDDEVTVYAKWAPLYSDKDDVVIIENQKFEGTYNTYFSQWIEAYKYNGELDEFKTPVYRNFYIKEGKLPDGLNLNMRTGEIYGIPEKVGTTEITVVMYNDDKQQIAASKKITIEIKANTLNIDHSNLTYSKNYGDADPVDLLKNSIKFSENKVNLDVALAVTTTNYVDLKLFDNSNNMDVDYSYVDNNKERKDNAELFTSAADKDSLYQYIKYAADLKNPNVAATKTDVFTLQFHRVTGEDAKQYKLYMEDNDVALGAVKGEAIKEIGYIVNIDEDFESKTVNSSKAKYVFTINPATLTIATDGINKDKTYGVNDPAYKASEFTVTETNATSVVCSDDDTTVTIAYTGSGKANFTDVIKLDLQRVSGEDAGTYQYYLEDGAVKYVNGVSTNKTTGVDNPNPVGNFTIDIMPCLEKANAANTNKLIVNARATKLSATINRVYGEMKQGDAVAGTFGDEALANNAGIKVIDSATVKLANSTELFSTSGKLKAGKYNTLDKLNIAISNSANPLGTKSADTKSNYNIIPNYSIDIAKKELTLTPHTINITKYTNATEQNIKDLVTVNGVIDEDVAELNITGYVINGKTYTTAAAAAAALIKVNDDIAVTINYNNFAGADASNYSVAGTSIIGTIHPVSEVVGGGGGDTTKTVSISCKVGNGGSISPLPDKSKAIEVNKGDSKTITITPDKGYEIANVVVDGESVGAVKEYTFKKVITGHSIEVSFKESASYTSPYKNSYKGCAKNSNCPMSAYEDISVNDWFHDGVHFCLENGYMNGVDITTFSPYGTTTRGMLVTILYRMDGSKSVSGNNSFNDVKSSDWYYDAVLWASQNGIVKGYDSVTFGPNNNVTREQVACILARYAEYKGINVDGRGDLTGFTDVAEISSWALDDVRWAISERLMNGYTDTTIEPNLNATRAQIATLIMRLCENVL